MLGEEVNAILYSLFGLSVFQPRDRWETKCQVLQNLCLSATLIIAEEKTLSIPEYCNQRQTQQIPFQGATQLSGKA